MGAGAGTAKLSVTAIVAVARSAIVTDAGSVVALANVADEFAPVAIVDTVHTVPAASGLTEMGV